MRRHHNLFSDDTPLPEHAYGLQHFDDNIQDEWFVVALLFELSKQIDGVIIRVIDTDGEFMLIEAADHIPDWANPDTCEQRVLNDAINHFPVLHNLYFVCYRCIFLMGGYI